VLVDTTLQRVLGMGLTELALLKPAMIQNLFLLELYRQAMPQQDGDWSLDSFFQQVAAQKNIPVVGLESVDDQIALLYNAQTLHRQAFLLVGAVREANSVTDDVAQLNALYRRGDLDGLLQLYEADTTQYAPTQQERFALLDERNDAWARRLPKLMEAQPCFIAVGAMHLAGENGLIALLKKAGYKVRAVKR
jgi:uncharacterized protein